MRFKCITCEALARPVYLTAAFSPHVIDVELVRYGLHSQPDNLRAILQERIIQTEEQGYQAILLVYGLCGKATDGLRALSIPLVLPRAHDCITLFLGSQTRYREQFENHPGTYWYSQDYIERSDGSGASLSLGSDAALDLQATYQEYVERYGKDNADYLMEVMGAWQQHYQRAVYIDLGIGDGSSVKAKAQEEAARRGWKFEQLTGDLILIRKLLDGNWSEEEFLTVPPGHSITMSADDRIVGCSSLD